MIRYKFYLCGFCITHPRYRCYIIDSFSPYCGWKQQSVVISFLAESVMQALKVMQLVLRRRNWNICNRKLAKIGVLKRLLLRKLFYFLFEIFPPPPANQQQLADCHPNLQCFQRDIKKGKINAREL